MMNRSGLKSAKYRCFYAQPVSTRCIPRQVASRSLFREMRQGNYNPERYQPWNCKHNRRFCPTKTSRVRNNQNTTDSGADPNIGGDVGGPIQR